VTWATSLPILVFLGLSVLDLGQMYATDRQTSSDVGRASLLNASALWGRDLNCKTKMTKCTATQTHSGNIAQNAVRRCAGVDQCADTRVEQRGRCCSRVEDVESVLAVGGRYVGDQQCRSQLSRC